MGSWRRSARPILGEIAAFSVVRGALQGLKSSQFRVSVLNGSGRTNGSRHLFSAQNINSNWSDEVSRLINSDCFENVARLVYIAPESTLIENYSVQIKMLLCRLFCSILPKRRPPCTGTMGNDTGSNRQLDSFWEITRERRIFNIME